MPLVYAAVARGATPLAEYAAVGGNWATVARECLNKGLSGRYTHAADGHVFTFLTDGGYSYVVAGDEAASRTVASAFLDRLQEDFVAKYGEKGKTVKEGGLSNYSKRMRELLDHVASHPEEFCKVAAVAAKVEEVRNVMTNNIESVLARGEKIDTLVDRTDNLMSEADRFVKSGRQLRRRMWWGNAKVKAAIACVILAALVIVGLLICFGGGGNKCVKRQAHANSAPDHLKSTAPAPNAKDAHAATKDTKDTHAAAKDTHAASKDSHAAAKGANAPAAAHSPAAPAPAPAKHAPAAPAHSAPAPAPAKGAISGTLGPGSKNLPRRSLLVTPPALVAAH